MKISAKLRLAFWLAAALLLIVGVAAIFFVRHVKDVLDQLHYYDFQIVQLAETQAALAANPADTAAHRARLHDLEHLTRTGTERRLLAQAREELLRPRGWVTVTGALTDLATRYRNATTAAHEHLAQFHRHAVLCTTVAVVDATVLLAVLMFLVRCWLLQPIQRLGEAADKIVAGDLQHPIVANGQDELDQLARNFNTLSTTMRELTDRVQKTEHLASIGEAASFVAHNLREPLAAIQTLARYERTAASVSPDAQAAFDHIIGTAATLERWVRNMVDSVRPFELNVARQPIEPIIHNALALLQRRLAEKNIAVQVAAADDLADAPLDGILVEQALVSLLANAADASPEKGRIAVDAANGTGELTLTIRDEGEGMNAETQRKAFDPFFTTKSDGAGLGLTIAKKIIDLHGGRLTLDSATGRGTCVRIALPTVAANGQHARSV